MIEAGLYQLLSQNAGLVALVGNNIFYQRPLPANPSLPFVRFAAVTAESQFTLDGPDPLTAKRYQFDSFDTQPMKARQLANVVRGILEGYRGNLPDGTNVESAIVQLDIDGQPEEGTGGWSYHCVLDVEIAYTPN